MRSLVLDLLLLTVVARVLPFPPPPPPMRSLVLDLPLFTVVARPVSPPPEPNPRVSGTFICAVAGSPNATTHAAVSIVVRRSRAIASSLWLVFARLAPLVA